MTSPTLRILFITLAALTLSACGDNLPYNASADTGDAAADATSDTAPDAGDDAAQDTAPDVAPDVSPDAAPDVAPDIAPDLPPACDDDRLGASTPDAPHSLPDDLAATLDDLTACPDAADWFALETQDGERVEVVLASPEAGELALRVRSADGFQVFLEGSLSDGQRRLAFQTPEARSVLVQVDNPSDARLPYGLTVTRDRDAVIDPDCPAEFGEPNDAPEAAEVVALGVPLELRICEGDVDWWRVELPAGYDGSAQIRFAHADGDLDMRLYAEGDLGNALATSESTADQERLTFPVSDQPQTFYVEVYGFRDAGGAYTLIASGFPPSDQTASVAGTVQYEDLVPTPEQLPEAGDLVAPRDLIVEVVRDLDGVTVGQGVTDAEGAFAFDFAVHPEQTYTARALARVRVGEWEAQVTDRSASEALYAVASAPFAPDQAPQDLALVAMAEDGIGGALNIADTIGVGLRFMAQYSQRSAPLLTVSWQSGLAFDCGSCYSNNRITLGGQLEDTDEYDDAIVLHELGHYIVQHFSADSSPGGPHRGRQVSPRLAYGEGLAYFWAGLVVDDPLILDTFIDDVWRIDMEAVTQNDEARDDLLGTTSGTNTGNLREEVISGILWDAYDEASDDEPFDQIAIGAEGHMEIFLDVFGDAFSNANDEGAQGIDLTDWLNALACIDPDARALLPALADDRDFPWAAPEPDEAACAFKGSAAAPVHLTRADDGRLRLTANPRVDAAHAPPLALPLRLTLLRSGHPPQTQTCKALPCTVLELTDTHDAVVVLAPWDAHPTGTLRMSWVGPKALLALRGGDARTSLSPRGPVRHWRTR